MIKERMLELLLLELYKNNINHSPGFELIPIDTDKYFTRLQELRKEFLEPYVIDSTSKER